MELTGGPCSPACTLTLDGEPRVSAGDYSIEIALDDGNNSSIVTVTITVIAAHDELANIRADLRSLVDDDAFTCWGEFRARWALVYLDWAARSRYWDDAGQPDSQMAFSLLRAATGQLTKIRPGDTSQPEAIEQLAERIVELTRRSALYAIDQAVDAGGTQRHIDRAVADLERGDRKHDAGKLDLAIRYYQRAWRHATRAL